MTTLFDRYEALTLDGSIAKARAFCARLRRFSATTEDELCFTVMTLVVDALELRVEAGLTPDEDEALSLVFRSRRTLNRARRIGNRS